MKIVQALEFQELYQKMANQPVNIRLAYKLNKLNVKLKEEAEFYNTELVKILQEYAAIDERGNYIPNERGDGFLVQEGRAVECQEKLLELQNLEIEGLDITFTLDELECLTITPAELACIDELITE